MAFAGTRYRDILHAVASFTPPQKINGRTRELTIKDLVGPKRLMVIVRPRMFAVYLIRKHLHYSLPKIGTIFNRDHTTILHSCQVMAEKYLNEPELWATLEAKVMALAAKNAEARHLRLAAIGFSVVLLQEAAEKIPQTMGENRVAARA